MTYLSKLEATLAKYQKYMNDGNDGYHDLDTEELEQCGEMIDLTTKLIAMEKGNEV